MLGIARISRPCFPGAREPFFNIGVKVITSSYYHVTWYTDFHPTLWILAECCTGGHCITLTPVRHKLHVQFLTSADPPPDPTFWVCVVSCPLLTPEGRLISDSFFVVVWICCCFWREVGLEKFGHWRKPIRSCWHFAEQLLKRLLLVEELTAGCLLIV